MENQGFVKFFRNLLDWEWYDDIPTFRLFTHLLLKANYYDVEWHGMVIKRGSLVTSYATLVKDTHLTKKQIERAMKNLIATGEVEKQKTNKYSLIVIKNYGYYQDVGETKEKRERNEGETREKQRRTNKEVKEVKEVKNINILSSSQLPFSEIIDYLNEKANTKYKHSAKATKEKIAARWNEGYRLDDFKKVIDIKCEEWLGTSMEQYLRPETLFGTKFESYLNQKPKPQMKARNVIKEIPLPEWFYQKEDESVEVDEEEVASLLASLKG